MKLPVAWADPAIDAAKAQGIARPGLVKRCLRLLASLGRDAPLKTELVHLPACRLGWLGQPPETPLSKNAVLVDGYGKTVRLIRREILGAAEREDRPEEFVYPLGEEETLDLARQFVSSMRVMRTLPPQAGAETLAIEGIVQCPCWVIYRRGRGGTIRFDMVDGLTGRPAGTATEQGFLQALHESNAIS